MRQGSRRCSLVDRESGCNYVHMTFLGEKSLNITFNITFKNDMAWVPSIFHICGMTGPMLIMPLL